MNRLNRAVVAAFIAASLCAALIALPNVLGLGTTDAIERNEWLRLQGFLSLSLPGLFLSLLTGAWASRCLPRFAFPLSWCAAVLLAVAIPAPGILGSQWADGCILWYLGLAVLAGGLWGWASHRPVPPVNRKPTAD